MSSAVLPRQGPAAATAAGLVERVQRRLATGGVAAGPGGLRAAVADALRDEGILLPAASLAATVRAISDELTGLGPLGPLLADPAVTDVLVNGPADVWVERDGAIERTPVRFPSAAAVAALVQRVVAPLGLRVDEAWPWSTPGSPAGSGSTPCSPRSPQTGRWSPSAPSRGGACRSPT
jgi:pilus assembly protein CpaF